MIDQTTRKSLTRARPQSSLCRRPLGPQVRPSHALKLRPVSHVIASFFCGVIDLTTVTGLTLLAVSWLGEGRLAAANAPVAARVAKPVVAASKQPAAQAALPLVPGAVEEMNANPNEPPTPPPIDLQGVQTAPWKAGAKGAGMPRKKDLNFDDELIEGFDNRNPYDSLLELGKEDQKADKHLFRKRKNFYPEMGVDIRKLGSFQ